MTGARSGSRIIVLGDVTLDVVVHLREAPAHDSDAAARMVLTGGGAGGNVASWLAAEGARVGLIGRVGADGAGREQAEELGRRGIELALGVDPEASTGTIVVVAAPDGSRTMYADRGANLGLREHHVPQPLGAADDHLHVSGYALLDPAPRPAALRALAEARAAGMTTSVDASSAEPLRRTGPRAFLDWIAGVDLLRASAAEAAVLVPEAEDVGAAARALADAHPTVVITDGAAGGWVAWSQGCVRVPAVPAAVVDTVGAGDAMTAGYLAAWVTGAPPTAALEAGLRLAARAVGVAGARPPLR